MYLPIITLLDKVPKLRSDGNRYVYEDKEVVKEYDALVARMRNGPVGKERGNLRSLMLLVRNAADG